MNEEHVDTEKLKVITGAGCVYINNTIYKLVVMDKDNNPIDIQPVLNKLAHKILDDTTKNEKNTISSVVRSLATYGIKPAAVASSFNRQYLQDFDDYMAKMVVVSPLWEVSSMSFMVGYLTAMFINKNDIQLKVEEVDFNEAEKATAKRLNAATILVESLVARGFGIIDAYASAVVENVITEEDLKIVISDDHMEKVLKAIKEIREVSPSIPAKKEKALKN